MERGEEKRRRMIGMLSLLLLLTGLGTLAGLVLFSSENSRVEIVRSRGAGSGSAGEEGEIEIVVDVSGAVEKPGVYRLGQGSRIVEALAAAGGLSAGADREFLSKSVNLSQLVTDGMKIYVAPIMGEIEGKGENRGIGEIDANTTTIYINSASREELESLWGVGAARTEAIIAGRPYSNIDDLIAKKVLPKSVVERNKSKLSL